MTTNVTSFLDVIKHLCNYDQPFPAKYLQYFTDLSDKDQSLLKSTWQGLNITRKLSLLEDLEDLTNHDTLMDFTGVSKIAFNDPDDQVREAALSLLWDTEEKAIVPILIDFLQSDPCGRVRASAASVMGHYVLLGETEEIPEELKDMVDCALLQAHHTDKDTHVQLRSLESLGYSSHKEVNGLIKKASASGDLEWLASALYAMGRSADKVWSVPVLKNIDHMDELVREEAIRAAGELGLQAAQERLIEMLDGEEDDEVRTTIIWSLSQIGGDGVREAIMKQAELMPDDDMTDFIEKALDNLNFTEELSQFNLIDIDDLKDTD